MKKAKRGFTLVELLSGMAVLSIVLLGSINLLSTGLRSFQKTTTDVDITNQNANSMRRISETLRQAYKVTISNSGNTISYELPALGPYDPITGERELFEPMKSDGVVRQYVVDPIAKTLKAYPGGRVLIRNLSAVDLDPKSTQYNQAYPAFQLTSIGSYRAISIHLVTRKTNISDLRYTRMKTTAVVRNAK